MCGRFTLPFVLHSALCLGGGAVGGALVASTQDVFHGWLLTAVAVLMLVGVWLVLGPRKEYIVLDDKSLKWSGRKQVPTSDIVRFQVRRARVLELCEYRIALESPIPWLRKFLFVELLQEVEGKRHEEGLVLAMQAPQRNLMHLCDLLNEHLRDLRGVPPHVSGGRQSVTGRSVVGGGRWPGGCGGLQ